MRDMGAEPCCARERALVADRKLVIVLTSNVARRHEIESYHGPARWVDARVVIIEEEPLLQPTPTPGDWLARHLFVKSTCRCHELLIRRARGIDDCAKPRLELWINGARLPGRRTGESLLLPAESCVQPQPSMCEDRRLHVQRGNAEVRLCLEIESDPLVGL